MSLYNMGKNVHLMFESTTNKIWCFFLYQVTFQASSKITSQFWGTQTVDQHSLVHIDIPPSCHWSNLSLPCRVSNELARKVSRRFVPFFSWGKSEGCWHIVFYFGLRRYFTWKNHIKQIFVCFMEHFQIFFVVRCCLKHSRFMKTSSLLYLGVLERLYLQFQFGQVQLWKDTFFLAKRLLPMLEWLSYISYISCHREME